MPAAWKEEKLSELSEILSEKGDFVMTTYSGLKIPQMEDLRKQLRQSNGTMKVVKNRLFRLALQKSEQHSQISEDLSTTLRGPIVVTFVSEDLPATAKVLVDYSKTQDKVQVIGGSMGGDFLDAKGIVAVAGLPSKPELLTIIGRGLNAPATKVATGVNEVMAKLARAIRAVGEKNG